MHPVYISQLCITNVYCEKLHMVHILHMIHKINWLCIKQKAYIYTLTGNFQDITCRKSIYYFVTNRAFFASFFSIYMVFGSIFQHWSITSNSFYNISRYIFFYLDWKLDISRDQDSSSNRAFNLLRLRVQDAKLMFIKIPWMTIWQCYTLWDSLACAADKDFVLVGINYTTLNTFQGLGIKCSFCNY